jgi:hypothetical protein
MTTHTTVIDDMAAKLTGIDLAKRYSEHALYTVHMAHPEIAALREGFLCAAVDRICAENVDWLARKKAA